MVQAEIIQMLKGVITATLCPALSLWMTHHGYSQAYCGLGPDHGLGGSNSSSVNDLANSTTSVTGPAGGFGWSYLAYSFGVIVLASDFFEFFYHWCGHRFDVLWKAHKHHHVFYNPSPFAVIADEYLDQFVRATPLVLLPMAMPINIDLMFAIYAIMFYGYGVYLHCGFEADCLPAHHPIFNTSFQHYAHHAISVKNKPYHTGFFIKIWDQLFGSMYTGETVIPALEARKRGLRTREAYDKVIKPDYSPLLSLAAWRKALRDDVARAAAKMA